MTLRAYISFTDDGFWGLFDGDGSEGERTLLTTGQVFEPGPEIWQAVAELKALAEEHGYEVVVPDYGLQDVSLDEVIEPEVYDEVFGADIEDET